MARNTRLAERLDELADMRDFVMELDLMEKTHGHLIRNDLRFSAPFELLRRAAKVRLADLTEALSG